MSHVYRTYSLLALALLAASPSRLAAGDSNPAVERLRAAYRSADPAAMLATYTKDALFEDVNQRHRYFGAEQLGAFLVGLAALHKSMDIEVDREVSEGDWVVVEYRYTGLLDGAALSQALGKEGCPDLAYSLPVTSWYRLSGGKIAHQRDFIDLATLHELQAQAAGATASTDGDGEGGA